MENYGYLNNAGDSMKVRESVLEYEIPEPLDQWAVEDFEQFASMILDGE